MSGCFKAGLSFSHSTEVPVPADVLWETIVDLQALPRVVSMVTSFERVSGKTTKTTVGFRFRETRVCRGEEFTLLKTVTKLKDSEDTEPVGQRWLSLGINFKNPDGSHNDAVNTSTLIVQSIDDETSRLILSGAFQTGSCMGFLHTMCCRPCIKSLTARFSAQELEDYRMAAMERSEIAEGGHHDGAENE